MDRTVLFSVHDLKVYPLTDAATPTYGAPVDVPGVSEIGLDSEVTEAILRGDGRAIDQRTILDAVTSSFTYGKLDPDVLAVLDGGTVTANAGATKSRYVRKAGDVIPSFGFACLVSEVDNPGGAAKLYVYNAKIQGGSLFPASDNEHGQPSFDVRGIPLETADEELWAVDLEDVGAPLPASGADFAATRLALV